MADARIAVDPSPRDPELSAAAARAVGIQDEWQVDRAGIDFSFGLPDTRLFPTSLIANAAERVVSASAEVSLHYTPLQGSGRLLGQVRERLRRSEGVAVEMNQLAMTAGSSQAIALIGRSLADAGDIVLVEAPTFLGAARSFRVLGLDIEEIRVDDGGIVVADLERRLEGLHRRSIRPRFLYTMPTFHNPTGVTQDLERRQALLAVAQQHELLIVEDDAYRELAYDGPPPPSLLALDPDGRVIRLGTYSKILAPAMRLGWIAGPATIIEALVGLNLEQATSAFTASIAAELTSTGALETHVIQLVEAYRGRRDRMLDALDRYCRAYAAWSTPAGGFFVWLRLVQGVIPERLHQRAGALGVSYMRGPACYALDGDELCLRLAFSAVAVDVIDEGVRRLGQAMAESLA